MLSNLPPGCSDNSIPGNRPEDAAFERFLEELGSELVGISHASIEDDDFQNLAMWLWKKITDAEKAGYSLGFAEGKQFCEEGDP